MRSESPALRSGEILAGVAGLVLVVVLFALHWLRSGGTHRSGWSALPVLRWLILVAALAALALAVAQATVRGPGLPVSLSVISTVLAGLTVVLLAIRLLTTDATAQLGAFIGLGAALAMTYGSYRSLREEQGWTPGPSREIETVPLRSGGRR